MADADSSLTLSILKEIRSDMKQQQRLLLQLAEAVGRHTRRFDDIDRRFANIDRRFGDIDRRFGDIEQRISDIVPELELILKSELMGRLTHFETQIDIRIDELAARIDGKPPSAA